MIKFTGKEAALAYMTANGEGLSPEKFFSRLAELESKFTSMIVEADKKAQQEGMDKITKSLIS